jgi:hypothetical protein
MLKTLCFVVALVLFALAGLGVNLGGNLGNIVMIPWGLFALTLALML